MLIDRYLSEDVFARVPELADQTDSVLMQLDRLLDDDVLYQRVLAWHRWRVRHDPASFRDTSPLSFVLSVAVPLALYFTWWYAPAVSVTSDAILLFVGGSMVLAALRASTGCEILVLSNWLLHRNDQIACAVFTPIDELEQRRMRC